MRWFWQKQSHGPEPDLHFSDPTHAAFNQALEQRTAPPEPQPRDLDAPWMKPDVQLRLPDIHPDFEKSHDRETGERVQERIKQTQQKQGDGSSSKETDQPKPALKPKGDLRRKSDQAAREEVKLSELRDQVMKAAVIASEPTAPKQEPERIQPYVKL